jgi:tape measure domain-containing protein
MQFRNDQFEQGVKKSLISLENLKKGLNLDKSSKSLSNLESTAKNFSMKNLASDVASISDRFSTMGIIGMTALQNITNSAIATGATLISALTIDPVKSGFKEYETQINAVQTILANTESKGTSLDQVNAALDELNHYADMTIYNFTEMTRNIGTFTAAGVDLDTSVQAIKGIANLAAVSGSNSQQASTAMYQLSQALAAGTVKLQDWNSVVNAGMGGQVFQDALKETARVHGVAIDQMIKDEGSFRETLSKGWLTSSILTETLSKFTGDLNESQLKTMGYTDEQIASIIKMGQTANDAATKVKTFTQLFDTLAEAMQSGWTQSWEYIVGDFDQAKESLTVVSDTLSDIINNSANKRNDLLYDALTSNYDKFIKSINDAGIETTAFQDRVKAAINENGGDADALVLKYGSLEKAIRAGAVSSDLLKKSLGGVANLNIDRLLHLKDTGDDVKSVQEALSQLGYNIGKFGADGILGSGTIAAIKAFQEAKGLSIDGIVGSDTVKTLQDAVGSTDKLKSNVDDLMNDITKKGGRDLAIESIGYAWKGLIRIAHDVKAAYKDIFPKEFTSDDLYGIIQKVHELSYNLMYNSDVSDKVQRSFKGLFSALNLAKRGFALITSPIQKFVGSGGLVSLGNILLDTTANVGDFFTELNNSSSIEDFGKFISDKLSKGFKDFVDFIDPAINKIQTFGDVLDIVKTVAGEALTDIWNIATKVFSYLTGNISMGDLFAGLAGSGIYVAAKKASKLFETVKESFVNIFDKKSSKIKEQFSDVLDGVKDTLTSFASSIKVASLLGIAVAIAILSASLNSISKIDQSKLIPSLAAIGAMFAELSISFKSISKTISKNGSKGLIKTGIALIAIAEAIKILANAAIKMSDLSWEEIAKGLIGVGGGLLELSAALKLIDGAKVPLRSSIALIALAEACKILGDAFTKFAGFSWTEIGHGLIAMGGALGEFTASLSIISKVGGFGALLGGTGILIAVQSLDKISKNLEKLGQLSWTEIGHGLTAMSGALGEFTIALGVLSKVGGLGSILGGTGLLIAVQSLDKIANGLGKLGEFSWTEIGHGLTAMGGALGEFTIALSALSTVGGWGSLLGATGILIAVQSLDPIATALSKISSLSWEEIGKGLAGMGGALAEVSVVSGALGKLAGFSALLGSGSILIGVQSLNDIAVAMKSFGTMQWEEIGKGLAGMGGALAEVATVSGLLGNLAGPLSLVGSGSLLLGVQGLGDLADALKKFGEMSWTEIGHGLTAMGSAMGETAIGGLLNTLSGFGAHSIATLAEPLGDLAESIQKWGNVTVPSGLGGQIGSLAGGIMKFNFSGWGASAIAELAVPMGDLADSISKWSGVTVPAGIGTGLTDLAGGIKSFNFAGWGVDNVSELVIPLGDLAGSIKKWNGVSIPSGMEANMSSMAAGINSWNSVEVYNLENCVGPVGSFADSIRKWSGISVPSGLKDSLTGLANGLQACNAIPTDNLSSIGDHASKIKTVVTDLTTGMSGADSVGTTIVQFGIKLNAFGQYVNTVDTGKMNAVSTSIQKMYDTMSKCQGSFDTSGMQSYLKNMSSSMGDTMSGVSSSISSASSGATSAMSGLFDGLSSTVQTRSTSLNASFKTLGSSMIKSFASAITAGRGSVVSAASNVASAGLPAAKAHYGGYYSAGVYLCAGLAGGIGAGASSAINAASNVAAQALAAAKARLGIHSPSREFYAVGDYAVQGLTNALSDGQKSAQSAGSNVATASLAGLQNSLDMISALMNSGLDTSPTITPVIDDSQVRAGIQRVNTMMTNLTVGQNMAMAGASFGINQNGDTADVVSAINGLRKDILDRPQNVYTVNGVTYDDGSTTANAVKTLVRAVKMNGRA